MRSAPATAQRGAAPRLTPPPTTAPPALTFHVHAVTPMFTRHHRHHSLLCAACMQASCSFPFAVSSCRCVECFQRFACSDFPAFVPFALFTVYRPRQVACHIECGVCQVLPAAAAAQMPRRAAGRCRSPPKFICSASVAGASVCRAPDSVRAAFAVCVEAVSRRSSAFAVLTPLRRQVPGDAASSLPPLLLASASTIPRVTIFITVMPIFLSGSAVMRLPQFHRRYPLMPDSPVQRCVPGILPLRCFQPADVTPCARRAARRRLHRRCAAPRDAPACPPGSHHTDAHHAARHRKTPAVRLQERVRACRSPFHRLPVTFIRFRYRSSAHARPPFVCLSSCAFPSSVTSPASLDVHRARKIGLSAGSARCPPLFRCVLPALPFAEHTPTQPPEPTPACLPSQYVSIAI